MLNSPNVLETDCTMNTICSGNLHLAAQWKAVTADKWANVSDEHCHANLTPDFQQNRYHWSQFHKRKKKMKQTNALLHNPRANSAAVVAASQKYRSVSIKILPHKLCLATEADLSRLENIQQEESPQLFPEVMLCHLPPCLFNLCFIAALGKISMELVFQRVNIFHRQLSRRGGLFGSLFH